MQQEEHLRYYFIISVCLHVVFFFLCYHCFQQKKVSFRADENRIVNVQLVKTAPKSVSQASTEGRISQPKAASGFKNIIQNRPKLAQTSKEGISLSKKFSSYTQNQGHYNQHQIRSNFQAASSLYDSKSDLNEPSISLPESNGLTFSDGESRQLIQYDTEAIKSLKLISDQECTLMLTVNEDGYITGIDVIKSTGDQLLDDTIISIIGKWQFAAGKSLQKAMLKLKYFIK